MVLALSDSRRGFGKSRRENASQIKAHRLHRGLRASDCRVGLGSDLDDGEDTDQEDESGESNSDDNSSQTDTSGEEDDDEEDIGEEYIDEGNIE